MVDVSSGRRGVASALLGKRDSSFGDRLINYAINDSIPAKMVKGAVSGATLPGDVYAGRVDPNSEEAIERAAELAGTVTLGSFAAPAVENGLGMGIRAYHGSPHDFDKFDISKIGTGEGAQAYGHGLYFAEEPRTAEWYRDNLINRQKNPYPRGESANNTAWNYISSRPGMKQEYYEDYLKAHWPDLNNDDIKKVILDVKSRLHPGHMYEVDIDADPSRFLDWDKMIQDHSSKIIDKIYSLPIHPSYDPAVTVSDVVKSSLTDPSETAALLNKVGIRGVKYLDQGSRGANRGTRNYVVFDPSIVNILRKYGVMGGAAGVGAAGAASQSQPYDAQALYDAGGV